MPFFDKETVDKLIGILEENLGDSEERNPLQWIDGVLHEYDWNEGKFHQCETDEVTENGKPIRVWRVGDGWTWYAEEFVKPSTEADKPAA